MNEDIRAAIEKWPVLGPVSHGEETVWINPDREPFSAAAARCPLKMEDVLDAEARLDRFADYFRIAFPETAAANGILESPLRPIPAMRHVLEEGYGASIHGNLLIKLDSHLPISGSIKARGGIYEVLKFAEDVAVRHGLLHENSPYGVFDTNKFRALFSRYSVAVGSTGNLGLSVGIIGARLGFRVTVHMSADARSWKKDLLRSKGVRVVEYASDYSAAVARGRQEADIDPQCHFIDDENSRTLFLGYSTAALRLRRQLEEREITVDRDHPLFVYLPCGVGGGPGGVAFGLKQVFGDAVHCFFAEPVSACCMLLGMATGKNDAVCVQEIGLDCRTAADGLAVGRASGFVGKLMRPFMSGCYTLSDERMFRLLAQLNDSEQICLEPSALAGMYGPVLLAKNGQMAGYLQREGLEHAAAHGTQLIWATGGSMVPQTEMEQYYRKGKALPATD